MFDCHTNTYTSSRSNAAQPGRAFSRFDGTPEHIRYAVWHVEYYIAFGLQENSRYLISVLCLAHTMYFIFRFSPGPRIFHCKRVKWVGHLLSKMDLEFQVKGTGFSLYFYSSIVRISRISSTRAENIYIIIHNYLDIAKMMSSNIKKTE